MNREIAAAMQRSAPEHKGRAPQLREEAHSGTDRDMFRPLITGAV
jgi:hypothetical protein